MEAAAPQQILVAVIRRLREQQRFIDAVKLDFEPVANARTRVRAGDVAALAARRLRCSDSPWFRRDLGRALTEVAKWRSVMGGGVRYWCGVRRKEQA